MRGCCVFCERTELLMDLANRFGHRSNAAVRRNLHLVDQGRRSQCLRGSMAVEKD